MIEQPLRLCERCYTPCLDGERFVRLGHMAGSTLRGDVEWAYTYLHHYDQAEGCVRTTAGVWD